MMLFTTLATTPIARHENSSISIAQSQVVHAGNGALPDCYQLSQEMRISDIVSATAWHRCTRF